jgi:hypothetical protein
VGQTLGVAVVGALATASVGHAGWWVLVGCGLTVLVLGLIVTSARADASAVQTAHELNPEFLVSSS